MSSSAPSSRRMKSSVAHFIFQTPKESKEQYIAELIKDYEYRLKKKDDEINELKRRIEEMSQEFAKMLKVTTFKIKKRTHSIKCRIVSKWPNGITIRTLRS